jgi:hypothetical protein
LVIKSHPITLTCSRRKTYSCTSWVFLIILVLLVFAQHHKKKYLLSFSNITKEKQLVKKSSNKSTEITGVGDV